MTKAPVDKSLLILLAIAILIIGFVTLMLNSLRTDPFLEAVEKELVLNIVFIIEREGRPLATEVFFFYPANARGALLDIPPETGLIIRSLNRMDRIDALYDPDKPQRYIEEIGRLIGTELNWYVRLDEAALVDTVDLLDGFQIFVPNPMSTQRDGQPAIIPSGSRVLDGSKLWLYANYIDPERPESELVARRQNVVHALLVRLRQKSGFVLHPEVFPFFQERFKTNLSARSLEHLFESLSQLDTDRLVFQRLTGTQRVVDGMPVLFPHYDGELVRDIVKQTLNALLAADSFVVEDKVFSLEILNGTRTRGLAQGAAEIFRSFGYEVQNVGNASQQDQQRTMIISHPDNRAAAETLARVIRCTNIQYVSEADGLSAVADFMLILGQNFNGRYCDN